MPGNNNRHVRALRIPNQIVHRIPGNIDRFFPNLVAVEWFRSELIAITASDLQQFPNLEVLSIHANRVESLDGRLLQNNPRLRSIAFNDNSLAHVGFDLMTDLRFLQFANFQRNPCVDAVAHTPEDIRVLNGQLPILCQGTIIPPDATCPWSCMDHIKFVNTNMKDEVALLRNELETIQNQCELISELKERIQWLEDQLFGTCVAIAKRQEI